MSTPTFPPEIVDKIISQEHPANPHIPPSPSTLRNLGTFSLVSKSWIPASRSGMFPNVKSPSLVSQKYDPGFSPSITLCLSDHPFPSLTYGRPYDHPCYHRVASQTKRYLTERVLKLLESPHCTLRPYLTHIRLCLCSACMGPPRSPQGYFIQGTSAYVPPPPISLEHGIPLSKLLPLAGHLRRLNMGDVPRLREREGDDVSHLAPLFADLEDLSVKHDDAGDAQWFFRHVIPYCSSLKHLSMNIPHVPNALPYSTSLPTNTFRHTEMLPNIQSIKLIGDAPKRLVLEWLYGNVVMRVGRRGPLRVRRFWIEGMSTSEIELVNGLLEGFGAMLEDVSIKVKWLKPVVRIPGFSSRPRCLDPTYHDLNFKFNTALKSIYLQEPAEWRESPAPYRLFSRKMIQSIRSDRLEGISMGMYLQDHIRMDGKDWDDIDAHLMGKALGKEKYTKDEVKILPSLKEVRIIALDQARRDYVDAQLRGRLLRCSTAGVLAVS